MFCREHGIVLLTFPPHTSHRLQPLDIAVLAAFKNACKSAFNLWISQNPGKCITIYNIASLTSKPYDEAFCRKNILSGFKKSGTFPLDTTVFKEEDFLSSIPTDQPLPVTTDHPPPVTANDEQNDICRRTFESLHTILPSTSGNFSSHNIVSTNLAKFKPNEPQQSSSTCIGSPGPSLSGSNKRVLTPEEVRPYPKAQLRKKSKQGRKKGRTCVLTDTPEKDRVE